jgi:hypothetical protein
MKTLRQGGTTHLGRVLVEAIAAAGFEGSPLFDLQQVERHAMAEVALREGRAVLLLVIPANFSRIIKATAASEGIGSQAALTLVSYPTGRTAHEL